MVARWWPGGGQVAGSEWAGRRVDRAGELEVVAIGGSWCLARTLEGERRPEPERVVQR